MKIRQFLNSCRKLYSDLEELKKFQPIGGLCGRLARGTEP